MEAKTSEKVALFLWGLIFLSLFTAALFSKARVMDLQEQLDQTQQPDTVFIEKPITTQAFTMQCVFTHEEGR